MIRDEKALCAQRVSKLGGGPQRVRIYGRDLAYRSDIRNERASWRIRWLNGLS